eukprot:358529-Chlamydomonas_euryale.AAC.2
MAGAQGRARMRGGRAHPGMHAEACAYGSANAPLYACMRPCMSISTSAVPHNPRPPHGLGVAARPHVCGTNMARMRNKYGMHAEQMRHACGRNRARMQ